MNNILYRLQKSDIFSFKKERTLIYKTFFSITFQQVKYSETSSEIASEVSNPETDKHISE